MAYERHETLDPFGWEQTATQMQHRQALARPEANLSALSTFLPTVPWPASEEPSDGDRQP